MSCDVKICIVRKTIRCYLPPPSSGSSCTLSFFPFPPPCKATFLISDLFIRGNEGSMKCAFALSVQGPPVSLSLSGICDFFTHLAVQKLWISHFIMQRQCVPYRLQWGGGVALIRRCAFISGNINNPFHSLYVSANPALRVTGVAGSRPSSLGLKVVLHPLDKSTVKCEAPSRPTALHLRNLHLSQP